MTHQMWRDHPFSHGNKVTEKAVGTGFPTGVENMGTAPISSGGSGGGWRQQGRGVGQNRQYRGGLHKIGGLGPLCQTMDGWLIM